MARPAPNETGSPRGTLHGGFLSLLFPVLSAILLTFSFPPHNLGAFAWFGLSPLLFTIRRMRVVSAGGYAFLFGALFSVGTFWWSHFIDASFLFKVLFYIAFGIYFFVFGVLYRIFSERCGGWIILAAPALWVALEYVRSHFFFLSFPWNLLGHSQYQFRIAIQIADIASAYGVSFVILMANQLLSELPDFFGVRKRPNLSRSPGVRKSFWRSAGAAGVFLFVALYGWHQVAQPESGRRIRVAVVQANLIARDDMSVADQRKHLLAYQDLTKETMKDNPSLIVWPSSSLPGSFNTPLIRFSVKKLARECKAYLLVGGAGREKFGPDQPGLLPYSNSEFLIGPSGRLEGRYDKVVLVPFDEYLPLDGKVAWPGWMTKRTQSFIRGSGCKLFEIEGARFGTPICWENMFPDFFRRFVLGGANFMVSVTNEGFFGATPAPYQSLAINVFRAVENRVTVVRSATTGVSGFIDPDGRIVERVMSSDGRDIFVPGVSVRDVPLSEKKTFYTAHGDVFAYFTIFFSVAMVFICLVTRKRSHFPVNK